MRDGRAEHEACIGQGFEFDRRIGPIEYGQLTFVDWVGVRRRPSIIATQPTL